MDKSDKKKQEEALKSSFMNDRNAAFLDAASLLAQWGNRDPTASAMSFLPFTGLGMSLPGTSNNHQQQQQQMAAAAAAAAFDKNAAMNSNWYAMAQMAAQDYFSRLQMSGLTGADIASLQALSGLSGYPNMNLNSSPASSSSTGGGGGLSGSNKNNSNSSSSSSKRKEKSQNDSYDKYTSSMDVKKLSASKEAASMHQHLKNSNNYSQSYSNANLQKDFFAMAAAAAASLDPKSLNDFKNVAALQAGNYVPNKNSNVNHNQMRSGGSSNNKDSNNRKASKDGNGTEHNNYSSKRGNNSDHANYQNLFKESNNTSLLGVRLPPDTEIIKYTSSGSKMPIHNSYNQGSSLDISISPKRKRMDTYENVNNDKQKNDMVEVIKLPSTFSSNGSYDQKTSKDTDKYNMKDSSFTDSTNDDAPLNLSMKSKSSDESESSSTVKSNNLPKDSDLLSSVNNLSNLQNLTAGIGLFASNDGNKNQKEGRPRNLGRGVSKPKKNTVASLLAQSRAVGIKPQQLLNTNCDLEKVRQAILDQQNSDVHSNTDSESYNDTSGISESDGESDNYNIEDLKKPLNDGWKRETIIKGLTKTGNLKGDVYYYSPYSPSIKLVAMHQIKDEINNNGSHFTEKNFSFSSRKILGSYLQAAPPPYATDGEYVKMTDYEVAQRLDEIQAYTRQPSSAAAQLNVEQRIEIARQQQALREAKKIAKEEHHKTKEKAKHLKDIEKCEKYEQQRKEKELKNFQLQEAKRKKEEELAKLRMEEQRRRQEEKERRRQHMAIIKQLEFRRKFEEREKKRHLMLLEKLIAREQKLAVRKLDAQIMSELRKPKEDSEILNKNEMPQIPRIGGLRLTGQGFADLLMAFEFLHNFGETLGFDMDSLSSLQSLHNAITQENAIEAEEELLSVMTHLLVCAIEDPGIPNPNRHTTLLGQTLRQADITHQNVSEVLRIYLYAVATGEVRQQTGICMERDRAGGGRLSDLHQNENEEKMFATNSKNTQFFESLHENERYKLSEMLKDKPYVALNPTVKAQLLGMLCNDLLLNKAVCKQIENGLESQATLKREKFLLDNKVKKYKSLLARKQRIELYEKSQQELRRLREEENAQDNTTTTATGEQSKEASTIEENNKDEKKEEMKSPEKKLMPAPTPTDESSRKSNLPDEKMEEDNSEDESEDLDEDEDATMTADEVQKKLEKILEQNFQTKQQLHKALSSLRGKHYGQDRYWRRYWYLPKCGGIYVEGLESGESDLLKIQSKLEEHQKSLNGNISSEETNNDEKSKKSPMKQEKQENENEIESEEIKIEENNFKHIEEVIKPKSVISMPPPAKVEDNADFDIEDSIPTAILVQKASKDDSRFVEINHVVPSQPITPQKMEEENCEGIKIAKEEEEVKIEIKSEDIPMEEETTSTIAIKEIDEIKSEDMKPPKFEPLLPKWFSLIDQEIPLPTPECPMIQSQVELFKNIQCKDEIITHGHMWEVQNNLHFYNPKILCESMEITDIEFKNDSILSTSGLDLISIEKSLDKDESISLKSNNILENGDIKKRVVSPTISSEMEINGKSSTYDQSHCFTLPPIQNMTINNLSVFVQCENLSAPQMTQEEQDLVDEVKKHGVKKLAETAHVPKDLRHGWFKISEIEDMNNVIKSLHPKGVREKILRQNLLSALSESIDLTVQCTVSNARAPPPTNGYIEPEAFNAWNPRIAKRVEQQLLDQVEALEDKIANASMQIKGWNAPQRDNDSESDILENIEISMIRERILGLEAAIERRYLKPPLGNNSTEAQLLNATIGSDVNNTSTTSNGTNTSTSSSEPECISKGLSSWREAVQRSVTSSQLSMALYTLEQCVAWDKSIMKANCQFCQSGESEDKLLLCDSCDRGYHTYCFKPKLEKIPEGDWFCFECINKVTGERKCIICGNLRAQPLGKLILCELCPRAYHHDCYIPPMLKVPRGKWYCANCISKAPPKKKPARKPKELKSHNSSQSLDSSHDEVTPNSPSASITSFLIDDHTTNTTTIAPIPNISSSEIINSQNNPIMPPSQNSSTPQKSSQIPSSSALMTNVSADENEAISEASDSNTHNSPTKSSSKERDDLKERLKAEKKAAKKLMKEMNICKIILEEMEVHEDSWPFLLPVNTKQFPTYKKVIKHPMDLSTIKKRLQDMTYKFRDEFVADVRQIFDNCEVFNEDDSPVGKAGHGMRKYFELRWAELTDKQQPPQSSS